MNIIKRKYICIYNMEDYPQFLTIPILKIIDSVMYLFFKGIQTMHI